MIYLINRKAYRFTGFSVDSHVFAFRKGWINRSTRYVPLGNIHLTTTYQSPFDRRLGLASLFIDTAGQTHTRGVPLVRHLPLHEARKLASYLLNPPRGLRKD